MSEQDDIFPTGNPEDKLDFELEPLSESSEIRPDEGEDQSENLDDLEQAVPALVDQVTKIQHDVETLQDLVRLPDTFDNPFIASVDSAGNFTELCVLNGSISAFADGRSGTATILGVGQAIALAMGDPPDTRFVIPYNNTGVNVTVVTGVTVSGTSGTINSQSLTVLAANATSSSNVTFPSGGTGSNAQQSLLFSKTKDLAGDYLDFAGGAAEQDFESVCPIPIVDNATGGAYVPWVEKNVFRVRAGGAGVMPGTSGSVSVSLKIKAGGSGDELARHEVIMVPDVNSQGWTWTLDTEVALGVPGTGSFYAFVSSAMNLSGPSLTVTGLAGGLPWSFAGANIAGASGLARGIVELTNANPHYQGTLTIGVVAYNAYSSSGGTMTLTSMTVELLGPALQVSP
jgi:hypothetical protein